MAIRAYKPPKDLAGERLDNVLSQLDDSYSRSSWQKLIKRARVMIDGQTQSDPAAKYKGGLIELDLLELPGQKPYIPVIYKDRNVIVYDKPAGMLTHAKGDLLEEWTLADIARPSVEDDGSNRPGIVHRLDRATSGVIIVARTLEARKFLQTQFSGRRVAKTYQAIVEGCVPEDNLSIDLPIARDPKQLKKFTVATGGKPAQTELKILAQTSDHSWLELRPKTGRTHQLRVHLLAIGHPIVGDDLYGRGQQPAGRLYLHASALELTLPSGQRRQFESKLPVEFERGLKSYGLA